MFSQRGNDSPGMGQSLFFPLHFSKATSLLLEKSQAKGLL